MKIQALSLYLCPYGAPSHLGMEVALGVPLGRAKFFFKQCFEFCGALGQSRRALGARRKKGIEKGGGRTQWTNLADFTVLPGVCSGLEYELGSLRLLHIVLSHKIERDSSPHPLLFCKMKSRVYLCVQLLNIVAACGQEEIKFQRHREKYAKLQKQQRFCFLNSIFKGKNAEPKINLAISVEEILIFLLENIF